MAPVVTSMRDIGPGRVAVELDGSPWRVLPAEAVARSGLGIGVAVDRPRARRVRAELHRSEALAVAVRSLQYRDHSRQSLADRLTRSRIDIAVSEDALGTLERLGLLNDSRSAQARASALAARDAGDLLIRADLERRGFQPADVAGAIEAIVPEAVRAEQIVAHRGASPRTFRRLTAKGFPAEVLEGIVADEQPHELG